MAQFLEVHPTAKEDKLDFFPGFYNLNCMLLQNSRKQEMIHLLRDRGSTLFNQEEMQSMVAKYHNFIGKDMVL